MCFVYFKLFYDGKHTGVAIGFDFFCNDIDIEGGKIYNNKINHRILNVLNFMNISNFVYSCIACIAIYMYVCIYLFMYIYIYLFPETLLTHTIVTIPETSFNTSLRQNKFRLRSRHHSISHDWCCNKPLYPVGFMKVRVPLQGTILSHTIHVWYIYIFIYLPTCVDFYGKCT